MNDVDVVAGGGDDDDDVPDNDDPCKPKNIKSHKKRVSPFNNMNVK